MSSLLFSAKNLFGRATKPGAASDKAAGESAAAATRIAATGWPLDGTALAAIADQAVSRASSGQNT
jgi:hypothetical protein